MSDLTNDGATAPADDSALFSSVTSEPRDDSPADPAPQTPSAVTQPPAQPEPSIPPSRLREEADARRAAERERDELRGFVAAFQRQQQPKQEPPKVPDVFEDPNAFLDHGVKSAVDPIKSEIGQLREFYSQREAVREHGAEKVKAAFAALDQAANAGDPEARAAVDRVKKSMHPFGDIVDWHARQTLVQTVGNDPNAWLEKQLEARLKDPAFLQRAAEASRSIATQTGNNIARPAVSSIPSLTRVGATALPEGQDDATDSELFSSTTRRKRTG